MIDSTREIVSYPRRVANNYFNCPNFNSLRAFFGGRFVARRARLVPITSIITIGYSHTDKSCRINIYGNRCRFGQHLAAGVRRRFWRGLVGCGGATGGAFRVRSFSRAAARGVLPKRSKYRIGPARMRGTPAPFGGIEKAHGDAPVRLLGRASACEMEVHSSRVHSCEECEPSFDLG